MSSGKECELVEADPGVWWIVHEGNFRSGWDWREDADLYGPFPSEIAASDYLRDNLPNPGGHSIVYHGHVSNDLRSAIEKATAVTN